MTRTWEPLQFQTRCGDGFRKGQSTNSNSWIRSSCLIWISGLLMANPLSTVSLLAWPLLKALLNYMYSFSWVGEKTQKSLQTLTVITQYVLRMHPEVHVYEPAQVSLLLTTESCLFMSLWLVNQQTTLLPRACCLLYFISLWVCSFPSGWWLWYVEFELLKVLLSWF